MDEKNKQDKKNKNCSNYGGKKLVVTVEGGKTYIKLVDKTSPINKN
jgi:hypothetical protein